MSWITLTPTDLNDYLVAAQLKALSTKALAAGQADPLPGAIAAAIARVRQAITSAGLPVDADETLFPPELKAAVAILAIDQAQTRLPGLSLTTDQLRQLSTARGMLGEITARRLALQAPASPSYPSVIGGKSATIATLASRKDKLNSTDLRRLS